ncbi:endonuclease III [Haloprofundus marisrubri]|uniref:Endonuclease III n=1 Tax=Haloprofundus marisrubri TaxID=1514971 RepID=A0A0W1RE28_9EURY|nr:GIY-YIG nuclease family protein [Haloprofundus marisrubri]KTG11306.1 endonuclease III [Haloprofundus marisrubri]
MDADETAIGGTYTLVVELTSDIRLKVGALGAVDVLAGGYTYTGSALGTGGFARVDRHREVASGERDVRHWHVDYLLGHPEASVRDVVTTPRDVECAVAAALGDGPIPGFGSSDCECTSHLARWPTVDAARRAAMRAHQDAVGSEK